MAGAKKNMAMIARKHFGILIFHDPSFALSTFI
jgi:hypothetical protein